MTTTYTLDINMSQQTVQTLWASGYYLCLFKAVTTSVSGGQPTVWAQTQNFSQSTALSWQDQFSAYAATGTNLSNGIQVNPSASYMIELGSTLQVTSPDGTGTVVPTGAPDAIEVSSQVPAQLICGLGQIVAGNDNILCALPLRSNSLAVLQPLAKVLALFTTNPMNVGTVVYRAPAPALLVDMTGAPNNSRTVTYDVNMGWQAGSQPWAVQYPPNTQLAPLLLLQRSLGAVRHERMRKRT